MAYGCNALGYLPHTLFWVDYIVRELNHSFSQGGFYWSIFGIGAAIGPVLAGICGDKFGIRNSLLLTYSLKAGAVALPLLSNQPIALFISSLMVGVLTPASVSLISTYTLEAVGYELHTKAWAMVTLAFAVAQGVGGYAMAYYASQLTSYAPLFMFGSVALAISLLAIYLSVSPRQQPTSKLGNNKKMKLYLNDTSPFSRVAVAAAALTGCEQLQLHWIDPWQSPAKLVDLNPLSLIPTLELDEHIALTESLCICQYLICNGDNSQLADTDFTQPQQVARLGLAKKR
ncbi:YbfB/YjiJ family MFS transporter [Vibrio sinaloensis]|nr:YbfB/YjiJ family MFS transporter [Vibrio sinaloensis]